MSNQLELTKIKTSALRLELQDAATSDDRMIQFLQRRGWTEKLIKATQESISRKLTVDLFGKQESLSSLEISYQNDIDRYYLTLASERNS